MAKPKAYITGICGFAGSYLAGELLQNGYTVSGSALPGESTANLSDLKQSVKIDRFDITNGSACRKFLIKARPDYLFHLAAVSSVGQSFKMGEMTFRVNVFGTHNILEAVRGKKWLKKIILISSSDVYGPVKPKDIPLKPSQLFNPVSPYALSKAAGEYLARVYIDQYEAPIIIVRPFNHTGPKQSTDFVIPAFCNKIVTAEHSKNKRVISVGNLSARRDLSDVRDIVRGYRMVAEKGKLGKTYHLCSGRGYRIGDLLNKLIGLSDIGIKSKVDKKLLRKVDVPILRGSYHETNEDVGWKPKIKIEQTLSDTLDFQRRHY